MYETEANNRIESSQQIPDEILKKFGEMKGQVSARTLLPWSEHCTECAWPSCYSTCELFSPREDGRCRRFVDGMVRIDAPESVNSYLLKIRFKRWGKLWCPGTAALRDIDRAASIETWDRHVGEAIFHLPIPALAKNFVTDKRYAYKKRRSQKRPGNSAVPESFLLECFNPGPEPINLSLTIRSMNPEQQKIPFLKLIPLTPGFHRIRVPASEIRTRVDIREPFGIEIIPNDVPDGTCLFFGLMDFVRETAAEVKHPPVKCVVWDLDHTVWDGILIEDGVDKLRLKPQIVEVIRDLDRRGILHSIASKNNPEDALAALKHFGIEEYFLCPQISWQPKSGGVEAVARQLNIGIDTLLFVDDSDFELEQVKASCPSVQTLKADAYLSILAMKECQVPVTAEGMQRRAMYRDSMSRDSAAQTFAGDYNAFLKDCQIQLGIARMNRANVVRVHELAQRTNQMNFSGNRYDLGALEKILSDAHLDTYVLECRDRFGSYGVIGFCVVDQREPRMIDLMFSCRIQSKRVEHGFLAYLLRKYLGQGGDFWANYRKTPRNAPSGRVFCDLGMEEVDCVDGVTSLVFRAGRPVPEEDVITITVHQDRTELAQCS
jgi:FkbH-like protein